MFLLIVFLFEIFSTWSPGCNFDYAGPASSNYSPLTSEMTRTGDSYWNICSKTPLHAAGVVHQENKRQTVISISTISSPWEGLKRYTSHSLLSFSGQSVESWIIFQSFEQPLLSGSISIRYKYFLLSGTKNRICSLFHHNQQLTWPMITSTNSFHMFWEGGETLGSITFLKFNSHHQYKLTTGHKKDEVLMCDDNRLDSIEYCWSNIHKIWFSNQNKLKS